MLQRWDVAFCDVFRLPFAALALPETSSNWMVPLAAASVTEQTNGNVHSGIVLNTEVVGSAIAFGAPTEKLILSLLLTRAIRKNILLENILHSKRYFCVESRLELFILSTVHSSTCSVVGTQHFLHWILLCGMQFFKNIFTLNCENVEVLKTADLMRCLTVCE